MSSSKRVTDIYEDNTFFGTYLNATDEKRKLADLGASLIRGTSSQTICDLGCFDGSFTLGLLGKLLAQGQAPERVTCVEPAAQPLQVFRDRVARATTPVEFEFVQSTMEAFLHHQGPSYDWIIASHSLYWMQNSSDTISRMAERARRLLIAIRDPGLLHEVECRFRPRMTPKKKQFFSGAEVEAILKALGLKYQSYPLGSFFGAPSDWRDPEFKKLSGFLLDLTLEEIDENLLEEFHQALNVKECQIQYNSMVFAVEGRVR